MQVNQIKENPDGSADFSFDLTGEEMELLVRWAIIEALKRAVEEGKKYVPSETGVGDSGG